MGHTLYVCESGTGKPISIERKGKLDSFIHSLPDLAGWGSNEFEDRKGYTISYHLGFLEICVGNLTDAPKDELRRIVAYARSIGLNLFVDMGSPEDEMEEEDIVTWLGPVE